MKHGHTTTLRHFLLLSLLAFPVGLGADTLIIPIGQQAAELNHIERPRKGMLSAQVEQQFGTPEKKNAPRGNPPISSWEYKDFVVYFEHDHVIHSGLRHRPYVD